MATYFAQACVLCGTLAEYCFADYRKRKWFQCPQCTEYQVTDMAERKLDRAPKEWLQGLAAKARGTPPNTVLVISVPTGPHPEGYAYAALQGESVPRDQLPQCL